MYVDLTKPDEPDEPDVDELAPAPVPTVVEKEPVRLTAREELMLPLRAFGAAVAAGSPVLVCRIATAAWQGVRAASQTRNTAAPAPTPRKADLRKDDEPAADSDEDEGDGGEEKEKAAPPARAAAAATGFGDTMERLAMGALVVAVVCTGAVGLLSVVWVFAAPYAGWIALGLVVGWCLAAAAVAPADEDDAPVNDHENEAGEPLQEEDPAEVWARQRAGIRAFVEGAVAGGATGHYEEKGRGASVDLLLALLRKKRPLLGWERKQTIAFLKSADIPVRDQVSFYVEKEVGGEVKKVKKVCPGVHVDDLTKELGYTPRLPGNLVPDITTGATPILTSAPPLAEALTRALDELSPGAPTEVPAEGRTGAA